ncbi:MAG: glycosyltransferase [Candidatus Phocaeicola faecipullorum]|nr:glycosyltransferase [Candidatus Phocaeicola faecipullorum]
MRVLLIVRGTPSKKDPQWGCFEKDQAEALRSYGHSVVCLSVDTRFRLSARRMGVSHKTINGIEYYNSFIVPDKILRIFGRRCADYTMRRQYYKLYLRAVRNHGRPDVIYSHWFFNTYWGVYLKNVSGVPLVGIEHAGRFNNDKLDKNTYYMASVAYSNADAVVAVSESLKRRLKFHFNVDAFVVNNVVSLEFWEKPIQNTDDKKIRLIAVASLVKSKGIDILIKACQRLSLDKSDWQLRIIGDGSERKNLQHLVADCGLTDHIFFEGRMQKKDIAEMMLDSSLFVLPSKMETFGLVYAEALASGLPVVATKCGGPEEIINASNGIIVPSWDVEALRCAIENMCRNLANYDRESIRRNASVKYSGPNIASQLTEVFKSVLKNDTEN